MKRNMKRLLKHLIKIINTKQLPKPILSLTKPNAMNIDPIKPILVSSPATFTNYPDPCNVCHQNLCQYNFNHGVVFAVAVALDESLEKYWNKKPPDGAGG